jgi:hypothetical protein
MSQAKEVVIRNTGPKMDQIHSFVSDKGVWYTVDQQQQLKAGLFYVAMPDSNSTVTSNLPPSIELRSPPPTPILTTSNTTKLNVNNNTNRKKKVMSILGSVSNASIISNNASVTTRKKKLIQQQQQQQQQQTIASKPPLIRSKPSLVDLNIEELSEVLKKMSIFNRTDAPPLPTSLPPPPPSTPYHQIGKGSSKYTLHFSIKYANHMQSILQLQKKSLYKKPFFSYTFLTHYTLLPAATFAQPKTTKKDIKTCYQLRGHLVDIQRWLDDQHAIQLDYILMDKFTKETIGKAKVPLQGIAFDSQVMSDKTFNVFHHQNQKEVIASVTIRIGLISGWHQHIDQEEPIYYKKNAIVPDSGRDAANSRSTALAMRSNASITTDSILLSSSNKKMRHYVQSPVPTLLTSSTTTSTRSSKNNPPTIHYVQQHHQQQQQLKQRPLSTSSSLLRKKNQHHSHHHHSSHFFFNNNRHE